MPIPNLDPDAQGFVHGSLPFVVVLSVAFGSELRKWKCRSLRKLSLKP